MDGDSLANRIRRLLDEQGLSLGSCGFEPASHTLGLMLRFNDEPMPGASAQSSVDVLLPSPSFAETHFGRIEHGLRLLAPYLRPAAESVGAFAIRLDLSDAGAPGYLSFDRPAGTDWPLIPDIYLLQLATDHPVEPLDQFAKQFNRRTPILFWRGSTTGDTHASVEHLFSNYRVRCCLNVGRLLGDQSDCKIARVVQFDADTQSKAIESLTKAGVFGDFVSEETFSTYQMVLDLPGNTAAWGTCLKYLAGCLVLKPSSSRELVYSHLLQPWEHYVPIAQDMEDAKARVDWVLEHQQQAAEIAWNGKKLMSQICAYRSSLITKSIKDNNMLYEWKDIAS